MGRSELMNRMAVLPGGRSAWSIVSSDLSCGAADDVIRAADIACDMVGRIGMTAEFDQVAYEPDRPASSVCRPRRAGRAPTAQVRSTTRSSSSSTKPSSAPFWC